MKCNCMHQLANDSPQRNVCTAGCLLQTYLALHFMKPDFICACHLLMCLDCLEPY